MRIQRAIAASVLIVTGLVGCSPTDVPAAHATHTSAAAFGGMDKLIEAAQAEGQLNVIALPPDWANYGAIIDAFSATYGITVNSADPTASSQDEINAANDLRGQDHAPDVFDLGQSVALANTSMFAPYKVTVFDTIPDEFKDPNGLWVNDYGGYMSIGYDAATVPDVTSVADLLRPEFLGTVALDGDPTRSGAAFTGVVMAALGSGGSTDDIAPGVEFFGQLRQLGNLSTVEPSSATIASGQTPVVIDWDYINSNAIADVPSWKTVIPPGGPVAAYYFQAINKDAPHPAAARLWQEFLFSDEGQNLFLAGGARPVRAEEMLANGAIDRAAWDALPHSESDPVMVTNDQNAAAASYLAENWAAATA